VSTVANSSLPPIFTPTHPFPPPGSRRTAVSRRRCQRKLSLSIVPRNPDRAAREFGIRKSECYPTPPGKSLSSRARPSLSPVIPTEGPRGPSGGIPSYRRVPANRLVSYFRGPLDSGARPAQPAGHLRSGSHSIRRAALPALTPRVGPGTPSTTISPGASRHSTAVFLGLPYRYEVPRHRDLVTGGTLEASSSADLLDRPPNPP